jgi:hypothetical protein
LSGIGSIVFRNEEYLLSKVDNPVEFDLKIITPYKGKVEAWYAQKQNLFLYFKLIILTLYIVAFPNKKIHFKGSPSLPNELEEIMESL